jgi:glycosyltransferase involved in cell wall biosynthesis
MLRARDYTVFHQSDHIRYFNALCRVRTRLGASFPVTAFIHSISYQEYMKDYLEMSLLGASSWDALICSSHAGKRVIDRCLERIAGAFPHATEKVRSVVVPLGIDDTDIHPERGEARGRLGLGADEVIALCFARFSEVDKMDLFPVLQAFRRTEHQHRPWRLVLAGAVHDETYLKLVTIWAEALGLKEKVTIFTDPDEVAKNSLFHAADFFVSPSDNPQETFGLTLLEAMWAGLPLIVSDFDGYRDIATGEVGFQIPTYWGRCEPLDALQPLMDERTFHLLASQSLAVDVASLADAMTRLFTDGDLRAKLSRASRDRFDAHFSHRRTIARLEALWTDLKKSFVPKQMDVDPLSLATFDTFSHYATRALSDDEAVQTSRFGAALLDKQRPYPVLPNMADIIDIDTVTKLMCRAHSPIRIGDLIQNDRKETWQMRYLVQWMIKHELLELVQPAPI